MMLRRATSDVPLVVASTVAGTAFPISALDALAMRALTEARAGSLEDWVRDFVGRSVLRVRIGERVLEDRAEQLQAILDVVNDLRTRRLALLRVGA